MNALKQLWPWLAALLAGVLLALCFPPFGWTHVVWLAVTLQMAALWLRPASKRRSFAMGLLIGFVFWVINLKWLFFVASGGYLLLAFYLALYFAGFALFASTVGNPFRGGNPKVSTAQEGLRSLAYAGVNAGLWCGLEWLRGWFLTGFSWNGLGVTFHDQLALAQGAEVVGVYGLSFLPVFAACVLVQAGHRVWSTAREGRIRRHWDFVVMVCLLFSTFAYGLARITMINRAPSKLLRVLLVQADVPQVAGRPEWTPDEILTALQEETEKGLQAIEAENEKLIAQAESEVEVELLRVDWVVWPEVVLPFLYSSDDGRIWPHEVTLQVVEAMQALGVNTFVAGVNEVEVDVADGRPVAKPDARLFNSLASFEGEEVSTYRKQHLVIYGEFIPFSERWSLPGKVYELVAGVPWGGNMGRGDATEGFVLKGAEGEVAIIPSICFEDTVPRVTRKFSKGKNEVILNITNDGWFGTTEGSAQHYVNALFRSIELRRPMLRSANRGVTGVVSATGSLVNYKSGKRQALLGPQGKPFVRGSLYGIVQVPTASGPTLYARFGDWFSIGGFFVAFLWLVRKRLRVRREKSA